LTVTSGVCRQESYVRIELFKYGAPCGSSTRRTRVFHPIPYCKFFVKKMVSKEVQVAQRPNLAVVDEAFGPNADLYTDVLQVQPNAGTGQIQDAYFDRRNELFQLLADIDGDHDQDSINESHRRNAERKMDAVVCSVRILGDPDLRLEYDDLRSERMSLKAKHSSSNNNNNVGRNSPSSRRHPATRVEEDPTPDDEAQDLRQLPSSSQSSSFNSDFSPSRYEIHSSLPSSKEQSTLYVAEPVYTKSMQRMGPAVSPELPTNKTTSSTNRSKTNKHSKPASSPASPAASSSPHRPIPSRRLRKTDSVSVESGTIGDGTATMISDDEEDGDETLFTLDDASISSAILRKTSKKPKGFLDRIRMEAIGACDDTARSFAQVCNVFTLQEADIKAVMGRIDKASRQLSEGVALGDESSKGSSSKKKQTTSARAASRGRRSPSGRKSLAASSPRSSRRPKSASRR